MAQQLFKYWMTPQAKIKLKKEGAAPELIDEVSRTNLQKCHGRTALQIMCEGPAPRTADQHQEFLDATMGRGAVVDVAARHIGIPQRYPGGQPMGVWHVLEALKF